MVEGKVILGVNTHVIHVNFEPFLCNHVSTNVVHEHLEGGGCVGEAEEHDHRFVKSQRGDEGRFPLVFFPQLDVVVPPSYIELGEEGGVLHVINKFQDER